MNTKFVMASSAVVMGAAGLAGSFAPHELLGALDLPASGALPLIIQLHGTLLLAFAITNWTARNSLIGGIYQRAIALGNLVHFVSGALTLGKFALMGGAPPAAIVATVIYAAFAIAFGVIAFGPSPQ
jgi:hypothetical protein